MVEVQFCMIHDPEAEYRSAYFAWRADEQEMTRERAALLQSNKREFWRRWDQAWLCKSISELITLGAVLKDKGYLEPGRSMRFATALMAAGSHDEAVEVLQAPTGINSETPQYWLLLARALGGAARFGEAREAALKALALRPGDAKARHVADAATLAQASSTPVESLRTWSASRQCIEACIALAAEAPARRALRAVLSNVLPIDASVINDVIAVAGKGLGLLAPSEIAPLIDRLNDARPGDPSVLALLVEGEARRGRTDQANSAAARAADGAHPARLRAVATLCQAVGDIEGAVSALGVLAPRNENDAELMSELAYCVGQTVLRQADLRFRTSGPRKVFNLVMFSNEFTLTELRMDEMADWVDHFVFVEAGETFTGRPKPLQFDQLRERLGPFSSKILHVKIDAFPKYLTSAWAREHYQRDMAVTALGDLCRPDDLVLITDADEIVDRRAIPLFNGSVANMRMTVYKFFFNYQPNEKNKYRNNRAGIACRAEFIKKYGSSYLRVGLSHFKKDFDFLPNAGWHFTSINTAAAVAEKFKDYSHQGKQNAVWRDQGHVAAVLEKIRSGAIEEGWVRVELDENLPAYIRNHQEELKAFLI